MISKVVVTILTAMAVVAGAHSDTFGSGANQFSIDFVPIGYAGNAAGAKGYGSVNYNYRIGKHEISINQLNKARALDGRICDGNEGHWNDGYRTVGTGAPASYVSWYEAARFVNWLTTGDAHTGVYQFNTSGSLTGYDRSFRNQDNIAYVLPTLDEWYKAACFKPDGSGFSGYSNGENSSANLTHGTANGWNYYKNGLATSAPNYIWDSEYGAEEQNGTHNMLGNVSEWYERSENGALLNQQGIHGGNYGHRDYSLRPLAMYAGSIASPSASNNVIGFRVAAIPEPMSAALVLLIYPLMIIRRNICVSKSGGTGKLYMHLNKLFSYFYMETAYRRFSGKER